MNTTEKQIVVIYHRADFDGLFCREIARKFLGDSADYIGWDYGDPAIPFPADKTVYVLDLSPECFDSFPPHTAHAHNVIWIDHHKTAIDRWSPSLAGYRIDGVAACRLTWQWFMTGGLNVDEPQSINLARKEDYVDRRVVEPEAVRLAGEYDIWDKRDPRVDILQLGLRAKELTAEDWKWLLMPHHEARGEYELGMVNVTLAKRLQDGKLLQSYVDQRDAAIVAAHGFVVEFEGLKFLALNSAGKGSLQFAAKDVPETGHDALLKFNFTGAVWDISLYHAKHRTELDLSDIAKKHGGGGHRGACGFRLKQLPWFPDDSAMFKHVSVQLAAVLAAAGAPEFQGGQDAAAWAANVLQIRNLLAEYVAVDLPTEAAPLVGTLPQRAFQALAAYPVAEFLPESVQTPGQ